MGQTVLCVQVCKSELFTVSRPAGGFERRTTRNLSGDTIERRVCGDWSGCFGGDQLLLFPTVLVLASNIQRTVHRVQEKSLPTWEDTYSGRSFEKHHRCLRITQSFKH